MINTRILGGKKAQARGNEFESLVRMRCRSLGIKFTHHPTGCKAFGKKRFHTIKTGYDFTLFYDKKVCLIDSKSFDSDRLVKSQATPHQVEALYDLEQSGFMAGYLIYFRPLKSVGFVKSSALFYLKDRSSISHKDMLSLGDITQFDLKKLFEVIL